MDRIIPSAFGLLAHECHRKARYAARASFETCLCSLVGRGVFFVSFLFGRSCFKLDMDEVLFIDALSES
jgi:hypothetical protein